MERKLDIILVVGILASGTVAGIYFLSQGGLTSTKERPPKPPIEKAEIRLTDIRPPSLGLTSATIRFTLELYNPATREIPTPSGAYDVYINDVYVGSGKIFMPSIPPGERRIYSTQTVVSYVDVGAAIARAIRERTFKLEIDGEITSKGATKEFNIVTEYP